MTAVDPLAVDCDEDDCHPAWLSCIEWEVASRDNGLTGWKPRNVEPHASRVAKAQRVAESAERHRVCRERTGHVSAIRELLATLDAETISGIADAIRHAPLGVAAAGRVLAFGGRNLGVVGSASERDEFDHAAAALRHIKRTHPIDSRDTGEGGTGELHLACAASRCLLALERLEAGR